MMSYSTKRDVKVDIVTQSQKGGFPQLPDSQLMVKEISIRAILTYSRLPLEKQIQGTDTKNIYFDQY